MGKKSKNPYASLRNCADVTIVDELLDKIGLNPDLNKRLQFLYDLMGVNQVFCANESTLQEKYDIAKEELVSQIWKPEQ